MEVQKMVGNYKELIIEMVEKIDNVRFLRRIYISLRDYLKEIKSE